MSHLVPSPIRPKTENLGDSPAEARAAAGARPATIPAKAARREVSAEREVEGLATGATLKAEAEARRAKRIWSFMRGFLGEGERGGG